jgi:hypothetical protein
MGEYSVCVYSSTAVRATAHSVILSVAAGTAASAAATDDERYEHYGAHTV